MEALKPKTTKGIENMSSSSFIPPEAEYNDNWRVCCVVTDPNHNGDFVYLDIQEQLPKMWLPKALQLLAVVTFNLNQGLRTDENPKHCIGLFYEDTGYGQEMIPARPQQIQDWCTEYNIDLTTRRYAKPLDIIAEAASRVRSGLAMV